MGRTTPQAATAAAGAASTPRTVHPANRVKDTMTDSTTTHDLAEGLCTTHPAAPAAPRCGGRAPRLLAGAVGAALGLTALTAAPAWAHDELLSATPEAGEVLSESPEEIVLVFTGDGLTVGENITNEIRVTDTEGESWETETVVEGSSMSTEFDAELPDGEYEVVYRVVYSDGHDEEDSYTFEVDLPQDVAAEEDAEEDLDGGDDDAVSPEDDAAGNQDDGETADAPDTDAADTDASDADAASQEDPATAEGQFPAWAAVLFALGGLLLVVLAVVLMRRKMTQVEDWKKGTRQPRGTAGSAGGVGEASTGDQPEADEHDDRPRNDT